MRHRLGMSALPPKIEIICIGKLKITSNFHDAINDYAKRINSRLKIIELTGHDKNDELTKIKSKIDSTATLICLDEKGQSLSSMTLAKKLSSFSTSHQKLQFIIGGADGLDDELRNQANMTICFGQQTWPHMMVRMMLVEQIYRAQQILANHPYHRE